MELLTAEIRAALPALRSTEPLGMDAPIIVKFFTPTSNWTWYATEFDGEDLFFGLVHGFEKEFGYFSLSELEELRGPYGVGVERDLYGQSTRSRSSSEVLSSQARDRTQRERASFLGVLSVRRCAESSPNRSTVLTFSISSSYDVQKPCDTYVRRFLRSPGEAVFHLS